MANFEQFAAISLKAEGGYQNSRTDNGNYVCLGSDEFVGNDLQCSNNTSPILIGTNHGISAPMLQRYLGRTPTATDMQNLSQESALAIYKRFFWDAARLGELDSQDVANLAGDFMLHAGVPRAAKVFQRTLKTLGENISDDGKVGSKTLAAANRQIAIDDVRFFNQLRSDRIAWHRASNDTFAQVEAFVRRVNTHFPSKAVATEVIADTSEAVETNVLIPAPMDEAKSASSISSNLMWLRFRHFFTGITSIRRSGTARREWLWIVLIVGVLGLLVFWLLRLGREQVIGFA